MIFHSLEPAAVEITAEESARCQLAETDQPQILQATGTDDSDLPYSDFYSGQDAKLCAVSATQCDEEEKVEPHKSLEGAKLCGSVRENATQCEHAPNAAAADVESAAPS